MAPGHPTGCALPQKAGEACHRTARRNPLLRRRGYAFQQPLYGAINNRKRQLPSCKTRAAAEVVVAGTVARPSATPKPDVRLSPHPAFQHEGHCHWYFLPWISSWQCPWSSTRLAYRLFIRLPSQ